MCASALSDGHGAVWVGRWICDPPFLLQHYFFLVLYGWRTMETGQDSAYAHVFNSFLLLQTAPTQYVDVV